MAATYSAGKIEPFNQRWQAAYLQPELYVRLFKGRNELYMGSIIC
jgi:hypothetical protein